MEADAAVASPRAGGIHAPVPAGAGDSRRARRTVREVTGNSSTQLWPCCKTLTALRVLPPWMVYLKGIFSYLNIKHRLILHNFTRTKFVPFRLASLVATWLLFTALGF